MWTTDPEADVVATSENRTGERPTRTVKLVWSSGVGELHETALEPAARGRDQQEERQRGQGENRRDERGRAKEIWALLGKCFHDPQKSRVDGAAPKDRPIVDALSVSRWPSA